MNDFIVCTYEFQKEVMRGHNIVADGWAGAPNPQWAETIALNAFRHNFFRRFEFFLSFPILTILRVIRCQTDVLLYNPMEREKKFIPAYFHGKLCTNMQVSSPHFQICKVRVQLFCTFRLKAHRKIVAK